MTRFFRSLQGAAISTNQQWAQACGAKLYTTGLLGNITVTPTTTAGAFAALLVLFLGIHLVSRLMHSFCTKHQSHLHTVKRKEVCDDI